MRGPGSHEPSDSLLAVTLPIADGNTSPTSGTRGQAGDAVDQVLSRPCRARAVRSARPCPASGRYTVAYISNTSGRIHQKNRVLNNEKFWLAIQQLPQGPCTPTAPGAPRALRLWSACASDQVRTSRCRPDAEPEACPPGLPRHLRAWRPGPGHCGRADPPHRFLKDVRFLPGPLSWVRRLELGEQHPVTPVGDRCHRVRV